MFKSKILICLLTSASLMAFAQPQTERFNQIAAKADRATERIDRKVALDDYQKDKIQYLYQIQYQEIAAYLDRKSNQKKEKVKPKNKEEKIKYSNKTIRKNGYIQEIRQHTRERIHQVLRPDQVKILSDRSKNKKRHKSKITDKKDNIYYK